MSEQVLEAILKQTESLTVDEQLRLVALLAERARAAEPAPRPRRKWREIRGLFPYPMLGEDAQQWVSRTRREGDEQRERQWRPTE